MYIGKSTVAYKSSRPSLPKNSAAKTTIKTTTKAAAEAEAERIRKIKEQIELCEEEVKKYNGYISTLQLLKEKLNNLSGVFSDISITLGFAANLLNDGACKIGYYPFDSGKTNSYSIRLSTESNNLVAPIYQIDTKIEEFLEKVIILTKKIQSLRLQL